MNEQDTAGPGADWISARVPPIAGTYALSLLLAEPARITVGRLGEIDFAADSYLYLGSAFGPGGLRARIRHHLLGTSRPHWHIDHLRRAAAVTGVWYSTAPERLECAWSQLLLTAPLLAGVTIPSLGFGSSDCRHGCLSHLVLLPQGYSADRIQEVLSACGPLFLIPG